MDYVLETSEAGYVKIQGVLSFQTITSVLSESKPLFDKFQTLIFDMQFIKQSDSTGLALLVEWLRLASQKKRQIEIKNLPEQMVNIAKACNLQNIFPFLG